MEWRVILLSIALLTLAVIGIAIKILLKKNGEFAGSCSSNNPMFQNEDGGCSYCGSTKDEICKKDELETASQEG